MINHNSDYKGDGKKKYTKAHTNFVSLVTLQHRKICKNTFNLIVCIFESILAKNNQLLLYTNI